MWTDLVERRDELLHVGGVEAAGPLIAVNLFCMFTSMDDYDAIYVQSAILSCLRTHHAEAPRLVVPPDEHQVAAVFGEQGPAGGDGRGNLFGSWVYEYGRDMSVQFSCAAWRTFCIVLL